MLITFLKFVFISVYINFHLKYNWNKGQGHTGCQSFIGWLRRKNKSLPKIYSVYL